MQTNPYLKLQYNARVSLAISWLHEYINNSERESWNAFCLKIGMKLGLNKKFLEKMVREYYPGIDLQEKKWMVAE